MNEWMDRSVGQSIIVYVCSLGDIPALYISKLY